MSKFHDFWQHCAISALQISKKHLAMFDFFVKMKLWYIKRHNPNLVTYRLKPLSGLFLQSFNIFRQHVQPLEKDYTMVLTGCLTNSNSEFALKLKYNFLGFQMRFSLIIFIIITKKEIKLSTVQHYTSRIFLLSI